MNGIEMIDIVHKNIFNMRILNKQDTIKFRHKIIAF